MTSDTDETINELKVLSAFFIKAEEDIRAGKDVDMAGIDDRITAACEAVQEADPKKQEVYLPALNKLLKLLNSCEVTMQSMPD